MTAKLQLFLKGIFYFEQELDLPEYDHQMSFENNCRIRQSYVEYQQQVFKIQYLRQILKCNHEYEIYLITESSINAEKEFYDCGVEEY